MMGSMVTTRIKALFSALMVFPLTPLCRAAPVIAEAAAPVAPCVTYDNREVSLTGTLFSRTYWGPPFWGELKKASRS